MNSGTQRACAALAEEISGALDGAAHVLAAAEGRLDLPMVIGALGDLNRAAVWLGQGRVDERGIAVSAAGVDGHVAFVTGVSSHGGSSFDEGSP